MPFDVSGNFTRIYDFEEDRTNGIKILASRIDGEFDNLAAGLNSSFFRNGTVPMTGNLQMGSNTVSGLGMGTVLLPSLRYADEPTTGIYLNGAGRLAASINGTKRSELHSGGLDVTGALVITSNGSFGGALGVTGATTLSSTLNVAGTASLNGGAAVAGALSATGNGTIGGTLGVTGAVTLASSITAAGAATFNGGATASALAVGSNITMSASGGSIIYFGSAGANGLIYGNPSQMEYRGGSHLFNNVGGGTQANITGDGLTVTGETFWLSSNRLLAQHTGGHGYLRTQSGNLLLGANGSTTLVLGADGSVSATGGITAANLYASGIVEARGTALNYGVSHTRAASPGQVGHHLYNGGGVCEWVAYQPAGGVGHDYRIATQIAGALSDKLRIASSGAVTLVGTTPSLTTAGEIHGGPVYTEGVSGAFWVNSRTGAGSTGTIVNASGSEMALVFGAGGLNVGATAVTTTGTSGLYETGRRVLSHASAGRSSGLVTISTAAPSGGANGDVWFKV
jgi:fibronectin-binding autotransporter adhesin